MRAAAKAYHNFVNLNADEQFHQLLDLAYPLHDFGGAEEAHPKKGYLRETVTERRRACPGRPTPRHAFQLDPPASRCDIGTGGHFPRSRSFCSSWPTNRATSGVITEGPACTGTGLTLDLVVLITNSLPTAKIPRAAA